jgi:hypothetical protein
MRSAFVEHPANTLRASRRVGARAAPPRGEWGAVAGRQCARLNQAPRRLTRKRLGHPTISRVAGPSLQLHLPPLR